MVSASKTLNLRALFDEKDFAAAPNKGDLYTELNLAWLQNSMSPSKSTVTALSLDMMRNWIRKGADNNEAPPRPNDQCPQRD